MTKHIFTINLPDTERQTNRRLKLIADSYHVAAYINGTWKSGWDFPTETFVWITKDL